MSGFYDGFTHSEMMDLWFGVDQWVGHFCSLNEEPPAFTIHSKEWHRNAKGQLVADALDGEADRG